MEGDLRHEALGYPTCFLIWALIPWRSPQSQNSLTCMPMICVLLVYIDTNLKIQEGYFETALWPLLCATRVVA